MEHVMKPEQVALFTSNDFDAFRGKTLEQKVQELADREEIKQLMSLYGIRVVQHKTEADLYTDKDDSAFITRGEGAFSGESHGREELWKRYSYMETHTDHLFLPIFDNYLIKINGDEAIALCSVSLQYFFEGKTEASAGYYENWFRRENGVWKFVVRDATFLTYTGPQA